MRAINIMWDTDGDISIAASLPKEIDIPDEIAKEEVGDYISEQTGFCHFGFELVKNPAPKLRVKDVLSKGGYDNTTPEERRAIVKAEQVRTLSKWGQYFDTYRRIADRIPAEWWELYSAKHLAEAIDLLGTAYSEGLAYGLAHK